MYKILSITAVFLVCFVIQDNDARRIFSLSRHRQSKPDNISLTVSLYYESLCPDCVQFSKQQLCPLWEESRLSDYFKIEFVPYGNAETIVSKTGEISFRCQHGPPECTANIIQACALKHLDYQTSTKFICCMEAAHSAPGSETSCAEDLEIDYSPIDTCANGKEGVKLHYLLGKQTDKLTPSHEFVPWVLFNGQYNKEDMDQSENDLLGVVCKYLKDPKPDQCNQVS